MIIALHCQTSLHSPLDTHFQSTAGISTSDGTKFPENALIKSMMNVQYVILTGGQRQSKWLLKYVMIARKNVLTCSVNLVVELLWTVQ